MKVVEVFLLVFLFLSTTTVYAVSEPQNVTEAAVSEPQNVTETAVSVPQNVTETTVSEPQDTTETPQNIMPVMRFLAYLTFNSSIFKCSATIISPRHILTPAHCHLGTQNFPTKKNTTRNFHIIRYEPIYMNHQPMESLSHFNQSNLEIYDVASNVYVHPSYTRFFGYDIAIVEFPDGTNFNIPPINIASDFQENDTDTAIADSYRQDNSVTDEELQNMTVAVYTPEECPKKINGMTMICTELPKNVPLDGPLILMRNEKYYQIGVSCLQTKMAGYCTPISIHCDWIATVTQGEVECSLVPELPTTTSPPSTTTTTDEYSEMDYGPSEPPESLPFAEENNSNIASFNIDILLLIFGYIFL